jgi:predicted glycosyltransferase
VLATAGGGEDGFLLLETFMRAAEGAPWEGVAVAGPMSPALKTLERLAARANVALHTFVPNLSQMFLSVDALVCMGGYNTLVEAVSKGVPTVCVPRTAPRREQLIRARSFERLGLLSVIEPEALTPENLGRALHSMIGTSRHRRNGRGDSTLPFDGARRAASELLALAAAGSSAGCVAANKMTE